MVLNVEMEQVCVRGLTLFCKSIDALLLLLMMMVLWLWSKGGTACSGVSEMFENFHDTGVESLANASEFCPGHRQKLDNHLKSYNGTFLVLPEQCVVGHNVTAGMSQC